MTKLTDVDQFYADFNALGLRFPNAELTKRTKEDKGTVSKILNRKMIPTSNFIATFYQVFKKELDELVEKRSTKVLNDTGVLYHKNAPVNQGDFHNLDITSLIDQNRILIESHAESIKNQGKLIENETKALDNNSRLITMLERRMAKEGQIDHLLDAKLSAIELWVATHLSKIQNRPVEELRKELGTMMNSQLDTVER